MATVKGFWENVQTGDIYVVESTPFGKIVGGYGPLEPGEDLGEPGDYDCKQIILEWLERALAENKLRSINPRQK